MTRPAMTPMIRPSHHWVLVLLILVLVSVAVPLIPTGPDVYVHLAWTHQVMRTVVHGELPVWMPDLNAGCGSPGIRLYSPAGPVISGIFALVLGNAAAGVRLSLLLAFFVAGLVMRREGTGRPWLGLALLVTAPPVLADFATRSAFSELLAIPAAWWLLERSVRAHATNRFPWRLTALVLAALWLLHAPTTLMIVILLGTAAVYHRLRPLGQLAAAGTLAALLTAWHWLPLGFEMHMMANRSALISGIFVARANLLGSPRAHGPLLNTALSVASIALLLIVLVEGWQRTEPLRAALITLAIGLASPLAWPLYGSSSPLAWLQFPWRWLVPAFLLAIGPLVRRETAGGPRSWAVGALWVLPLLVLPLPPLVHAPRLTVRDGWQSAGRKMMRAIGANPLYVDATQNRPPWYPRLIVQLPQLHGALAAATTPLTRIHVVTWKPLDRTLLVDGPQPARVTIRLLDDPWWSVTLDRHVADTIRERGMLMVRVPPGHHTVRITWTGDPWSRVGLGLALVGLLLFIISRRSDHTGQ